MANPIATFEDIVLKLGSFAITVVSIHDKSGDFQREGDGERAWRLLIAGAVLLLLSAVASCFKFKDNIKCYANIAAIVLGLAAYCCNVGGYVIFEEKGDDKEMLCTCPDDFKFPNSDAATIGYNILGVVGSIFAAFFDT